MATRPMAIPGRAQGHAGLRERYRRARTRMIGAMASVGARARRTSRIMRARAGYAAGVATAAWGVGVQFGLGWALMLAGVAASASFLLLYPVDEP